MPQPSEPDWPEAVYRVLQRQRVRQVAYVPDAGHRKLIEYCQEDASIRTIPLTTEEEGVALLAGAWLGGERGVLLMQSSGVGNCVNMFSLPRICRLPLLLLVTMRGETGEANPWQEPMGQNAAEVLDIAGVEPLRVESADAVGAAVDAALTRAYRDSVAIAVLIAQRVIGVKEFRQ